MSELCALQGLRQRKRLFCQESDTGGELATCLDNHGRHYEQTDYLRNRVSGAEAKRLRLRLQILRPQPSASSRPEERVSGAIITREQICVWRAASSGELTRFVGPVCARSIVSGAELFKSCLGRNGRLSSRCLVAAKSKC